VRAQAPVLVQALQYLLRLRAVSGHTERVGPPTVLRCVLQDASTATHTS